MSTTTSLSASASVAAKRIFYKSELDALRFVAFLMVFVHHCPFPSRHPILKMVSGAGGFGVCIFFALSSYLIAALLMRERDKTGSVHIKAFFIRRVLRIWPLYFLGLALGFIAGAIIPQWHVQASALPYLLGIVGNLYILHAGWHMGVINPLWSLSIEEQFYLLIPAIARFGGSRALMVVSGAFIAASYATLLWLGHIGAVPHVGVWANSFVQFQFFGAGTLLAIYLHKREWSASLPIRIGMLVVSAAAFLCADGLCRLNSDQAQTSGHLCLGYLLLLAGSLSALLAFINVRVVFPQAVLKLGRISFGLYVFHYFILQSAFYPGLPKALHTIATRYSGPTALLALLVTIGIAATSFQFFESPILRLKERFVYVKSGAPPTA